jgi:hypothetical protein
VHGQVLAQWPQMFRILDMFGAFFLFFFTFSSPLRLFCPPVGMPEHNPDRSTDITLRL